MGQNQPRKGKQSKRSAQAELWLSRAKHFITGKAPGAQAPLPPTPKTVRKVPAKRPGSTIDLLPGHSLPLFGLTSMPAYDLPKCAAKTKRKTKGRGIGKEPVDHLLTHSLPLFGLGYELLERDSNSESERTGNSVKPKPDTPVIT